MTEPPQDRLANWLEAMGSSAGAGLGIFLISLSRVIAAGIVAYPLALAAAFYAKSLPRDANVWSLAAVWSLWAAMYHLGSWSATHGPKYRSRLREQAGR